MKFKNNHRLNLLLEILPKTKILADIGTDHAYLAIEAIKRKKASFVYAADLRKNPLEQAKKNIYQANLEKKIIPVLTNGLTYFKENNVLLDFVVISGLGTKTIIEILINDYHGVSNYLICSNTNTIEIRRLIKKNKWNVVLEKFIIDHDRQYWIIQISKNKGLKIKTTAQIILGIDPQLLNDQDYLEFLMKKYHQNEQIIKISHDRKKIREMKKNNRIIRKTKFNGIKKID